MYRKFQASIIIFLLLSILAGCGPAQPKVDDGATKTVVAAAEATKAVPPTATVDAAATKQAEEKNAQATSQAATEVAAKQTADAAAAATATKSAQATGTAQAKAQKTATAVAKATTQAGDMAKVVADLKEQGVLKASEGKYYHLADFDEKWAQIGWYNWWPTGLETSNFVIRAHTGWESATNTPNPGGCGFVFRAKSGDDHYMIFLASDGNVWFHMFKKGVYTQLARKYYGKVNAVKDEADVMLAVEGRKIYYFVNGKKVVDLENQTFDSGMLALTLISGTNKDWGTRCTMSNIEIWDMGQE